mmetsp:Transcript_110154/g.191009  ORF Transcript_110154/g.191009 Transcript_110154/m.191009 type:complete len:112 (-) Transcript_110154:205-540(-)
MATEDGIAAAKARVEEASKALSEAEAEHDAARTEYENQFSLARRTFKSLGSKTKAYRAENIAPKEEAVERARERLNDASRAQQVAEGRSPYPVPTPQVVPNSGCTVPVQMK